MQQSIRRIKKSGSTLITIGFVIQPKIGPIWPLETMAGTMATTASKYSRDFSKFSDYHTSGKFERSEDKFSPGEVVLV